MTSADILDIAGKFDAPGTPVCFSECKSGHINSTYIVDFDDNGSVSKFVLQKINTYVFKKPEYVMSNIFGVTEYLRGIIAKEGGDPERQTLNFVRCRNGDSFFKCGDDAWRMYKYIDDVKSYALADTTDLFRKAGFSFGQFQLRLAGYDASSLYETIPDFHNTKKRFERFTQVVDACTTERKKIAREQIEFVIKHKDACACIVDEIEAGKIPLRVTHNDTKLNNILMDAETGEGVCIIDLDTVMPGSVLYDFGDSIRFGASNALEDEADLDKVFFRTDMFEAFARGYIEGAGGSLTHHEIEMLPVGTLVITLETGMRFLTDYLENDVYFKTAFPEHNLVRAKNQLKLVSDIEGRMDEFVRIIQGIL